MSDESHSWLRGATTTVRYINVCNSIYISNFDPNQLLKLDRLLLEYGLWVKLLLLSLGHN